MAPVSIASRGSPPVLSYAPVSWYDYSNQVAVCATPMGFRDATKARPMPKPCVASSFLALSVHRYYHYCSFNFCFLFKGKGQSSASGCWSWGPWNSCTKGGQSGRSSVMARLRGHNSMVKCPPGVHTDAVFSHMLSPFVLFPEMTVFL
jgi:hypothetical protein